MLCNPSRENHVKYFQFTFALTIINLDGTSIAKDPI